MNSLASKISPSMKRVNTPTTNTTMLAWRRFKIGATLFLLSAILIFAGYLYHPLIQVPGLILLIPAIIYAVIGYFGIVRSRLSTFKK